ncbi:MAG: hypothetical protein IKE12_08460 [Erysipelotrichaceae bacterium]|nr:hypothetical protein [Erysipelotrichaceae bacterium]MBQ1315332.1 hypothetical protein [Erysipelotrichaceae bacterium]MBQ2214641.1 hypothetical protein [Erysipelotrichaceae bacterium]MBR2792669.1 hypothetical protein [Erysipelotrichaceae bacterium]
MLTLSSTTSETSSNMTLLFYVIFGFMILMFLFRAGLGYRRYKNSIYPHIYDNYLIDYFYKLNVFRDASKSGLLKKLIGYHRLNYATITNNEGKMVTQIITLIHSKGLLSIAYLTSEGKYGGSDSGNWYIRRTEDGNDKKYKIENPVIYLKEYNLHLSQALEGRKSQSLIAVPDNTDITNLHSSYKVVKYSELEDVFREADCGYGLNNAEIDEIYEKLGGKVDRK